MLASFLALTGAASGQFFNTDLEVHVNGLPSLLSKSPELSDVLPTSLDTILHDRSICCGKDSALEDSVAAADPLSLKDVATKLQGRHLLSDGRPIQVTVDFWPSQTLSSGELINALMQKHALLMSWNSRLYVVYGAIYQWMWIGRADSSSAATVIRKLLLLDTRYSDSRRKVEFDRGIDDLTKVQGLLAVQYELR